MLPELCHGDIDRKIIKLHQVTFELLPKAEQQVKSIEASRAFTSSA